MAALHEQRLTIPAEFAPDTNPGRHGWRKHLRDGAVEFLDDVQLLNAALAQLRITHDPGDDPVGARDLLLDDFNLLRRAGFAGAKRALQRERGVVDDGQRILDLVREFGGEPAGGVQLAFPRGKFRRLLGGPPLALRQHLHAITAGRQQPQHKQPRQIRFNAGFIGVRAERQVGIMRRLGM